MAVDPRYQTQALDFITETMKSVIPDANVDGGSGINAILGRGASAISAGLLQEIDHVTTSRDLTDTDINDADVDLILENLLTSRDGGDLAFGFVRIYYGDRVVREFGAGLVATDDTSTVKFNTLADLSFSPQDYLLDQSTGEYYLSVPFAAIEAGDEYNLEAGEINKLENDASGATRVTNSGEFSNGKPAQTNAQAIRKAQRSVSTRTPLSTDGAVFWFQELFGAKLADVLVVGAGEDEMLRDEVFDLGSGLVPRFQVGVDGIDATTREQLGTAQSLFVGGRTDYYLIFETINYIQVIIDLFADMTLDADISAGVGTIVATFITGTTGTVPATGKLILDLGNSGEETVSYSSQATPDSNTYTFTLSGVTSQIHAADSGVKAVNNSEITIAPDGDVQVLPVFQIAEVRPLDPVTLEPVADAIPETTPESSTPGWYFSKSNRYDILSAKETKTLVVDEKSDFPGNAALTGVNGTATPVTIGSGSYTKLTYGLASDFSGYQGREITLSIGGTRTIVQVTADNEFVVDGDVIYTADPIDFSIDSAAADYSEFPVRISFYTSAEIQEAQQFLDQDSRRILANNPLAKMFMPAFIDFVLQYRGDGTEANVREKINEVLKTSSGDAIGDSSGAKFEYSDIVAAAYEDGLANYVSTPFEVRVRKLRVDGGFDVQYLNPGPDTVNDLAVVSDPGATQFKTDGAISGNTLTTSGGHTFVAGDVGKRVWINGYGLATITAVADPSATLDRTFDVDGSGLDWSFPAFFIETRMPGTEFNVPEQGRLYLGAFTDNVEEVEYSSVVVDGTLQTFIVSDGQSINMPHAINEPLKVSVLDYDEANVIVDGVISNERTYRPVLGVAVIEKL